ncbi:MAG: hypothetical protein IJ205_08735 [Bacteroidales bacterium]|nr:hypothetical protein [Bacteroidales bacterium]
MGNIDEKTISGILARIDAIKEELSELEQYIKTLSAEVPEPAPVSEPVPVPEPVEEHEPLDLNISDIEMPVPPVIEPVEEPAGEDLPAEEEAAAADIMDDIPEDIPSTVPEPVVEEPRKPLLDTAKAETAVMDVMADKQAWRTDRPGMPVKNIISAISLNDRVLLINVLFREDPMLFQDSIAKFNSMGSLSEALEYISANFPEWDMNSEPVYRLMMAVRRKLS